MKHLLVNLDSVLVYISEDKSKDGVTSIAIHQKCLPTCDLYTIEAMIKYLKKLGYITSVWHKPKDGIGVTPQSGYSSYKVSFEGFLFLEKSSFKSQHRYEMWNKAFIRFKTIMAISISLSIVYISWLTYLATDKANDNLKETTRLNATIDSLKNEVKSSEHLLKPDSVRLK